jgi:alpha-beta hydrolase superfamily lysophospholipase
MSHASRDSTLSTFTASDGENLAVQDWPLADPEHARGVVLLVHGLGEHAGRYDPLAHLLNSWGFIVRGYDHYGHGQSNGTRGGLPQNHRLLDDLADVVESTRNRHSELPLVLFGHSLGGLVAAGFVARGIIPVDGLVLSSPLLAARLTPVQKMLMAIVPRVAPNLTVSNGLDPAYLSHDENVVAAYRADPLVHDRISGRLARFIGEEAALVRSCAPRWLVPTLLLYAGADRLVDPSGSASFAEAAPRSVVRAHCFPDLYHEVLNEVQSQVVYALLRQWLDARF